MVARRRTTDIPGKIGHNRVVAALIFAAGAYFLVYYLSDPNLPGGAADPLSGWFSAIKPNAAGWFGYYDQGHYLNIAHTIAGLHFAKLATPRVYTYGIGYPVTAVIGLWLGVTKDPFVFFDLFAFVFPAYAVFSVGTKLISPVAGVVAAFGLVFATPLIAYVDQPWNSTVCLTVMSFLLLTLTRTEVSRSRAFAVGIMLGWAFAARFVDILWLGIVAAACMYRGSIADLIRRLSVPTLLGALVVVLPVLYLDYKTFGSVFKTPYVTHLRPGAGSDQGLSAYHIRQVPNSALGIFVSPLWAGSTIANRGLLIDFFWALGAVPGLVVLWRRGWRRVFLAAGAVTLCADWTFYLSFRASGNYSVAYGELHYFKDFWPVVAILAAGIIDAGVKRVSAAGDAGAPTSEPVKPLVPTGDEAAVPILAKHGDD